MIKITIFLLFVFSIQANEVRLCYDKSVSLIEVKDYLMPMLISIESDSLKIDKDENCLVMESKQRRQAVLEVLLEKKYPVKYSSFGDEVRIVGDIPYQCRISFEKMGTSQMTTTSAGVSVDKTVSAQQQNITDNNKGTIQLVLSTGKKANVTLGGESFGVMCRRTAGSFNIELSYKSTNNSISSNVDVSEGQKLEVASVLESLISKNNSMGISGAGIGQTKKDLDFKYYITVK